MKPDERESTRISTQRFIGFRVMVVTGIVLLSFMVVTGINAWSFGDVLVHHLEPCRSFEKKPVAHTRRDVVAIAFALIGAGPLLLDAERANANTAEGAGDPRERFVAAQKELRELINNYSDITAKGGGDAVRNRLGTQGVSSNLFGIQKLLKTLTADAEDIIEYTETMEEFNVYYFQAEGAAYQSMFIEHSSAKGTPDSILKTAKTDIMQMEKYMDQLALQLKL